MTPESERAEHDKALASVGRLGTGFMIVLAILAATVGDFGRDATISLVGGIALGAILWRPWCKLNEWIFGGLWRVLGDFFR